MGAEGCSLDRPELRQAANPLLGRLISMGFLDEQRALPPPVEFGREHLGWQEEGDEAVDIDRWMSLADESRNPAVAAGAGRGRVSAADVGGPWWLLVVRLMAWCTSR